jgi:hypothetical protein
MLQGNKHLYPDAAVPENESNQAFLTRFCMWADASGFSEPEFLLPVIRRETTIQSFRFERRFAISPAARPAKQTVDSMGPWEYQIDWSGVSTRERKGDWSDLWVEWDWKVHRYRSSLLIDLAAELAGAARGQMSVLDAACHCGIFTLEFAEAGFGSVSGLDLRPENIRQAQFLAQTFQCRNVVFEAANVRDLRGRRADIVFCGGLLYHVTFPVELMADLFDAAGELLILDSLCQNHPFSGFHLYGGKDIQRSLEGDNTIELVPTYRAIIDLMRAAGFSSIYEIIGDRWEQIPFYKKRQIRSFVAAKPASRYAERLAQLSLAPEGC